MITGPIYLGRFTVNDLVHFKFTTFASTGAPTTLAGTPVLKAFVEGNTTPFTTGITLTVDYGTITGLNDVVVDTSSGYVAGKQYTIVITTGTVSAISHVGYVVGHFFLQPEPADLRAVNGGSTGATAKRLELEQLLIAAPAGQNGLHVTSSDTAAVQIESTGSNGVAIAGSTSLNNNPGLNITSNRGSGVSIGGNINGVEIFSNTTGAGIYVEAQGSGDAIQLVPDGTGKAVNALGTIAINPVTGDGIQINSSTYGMRLETSGAGYPGVWFRGGPAGGYPAGPGLALLGGDANTGAQDIGGAALELMGGSSLGAGKKSAGPAIHASTGRNDIDGLPAPAFIQVDNALNWNNGDPVDTVGDIDALKLVSKDAGKAINALGQVLIQPTNTNDDALVLLPNGTGLSINAPVESGVDLISSLKLANAANAGKTDGMGGVLVHLRDAADTLNRVTATVDANGNRTAITLNLA